MTFDTCRYNPRLGCDCGFHKPSLDVYITDPIHGGKIVCHECSDFFRQTKDVPVKYSEGVYFHEGCFNRYKHYYGLDKPID